jgi:hypothetical protein
MHRSLPIEAKLSSPTKRFSFVGLEFQVCQSGQSSSGKGYKPPPPETIFLYAVPVTLDVFRRETRGCRDAKAKCA